MYQKKDKIFNNTFNEKEFEPDKNFSFTVDASWDLDKSIEDDLHYKLLYDAFIEIITKSEFYKLNQPDKRGNIKKLNKVQINKVFGFTLKSLGGSYKRWDLFAVLSDYFDIYPKKFYSSLSNEYKDQILNELDVEFAIREKYGLNKLF